MESGSDDDFQSVAGDVPPSPSGSDRSGSSRQLPPARAGSWGGMLSPMERVRNAEQDSSQASSPETATPEVVATALPNGRQSDSATEVATPSRTPQSALRPDPGTATSASGAASPAVTPPPAGLDGSATLAAPQLTFNTAPAAPDATPRSLQQLAQMIIRDKETGKEYMIADLGGDADQLSSQKLINLSTNETLVLQYDTLDPENGSTTARSGSHNARSASSSQMQAVGPDAAGAASGRATPRDNHGEDGAVPGLAAALTSPTAARKTKNKVKAWGKQARSWLPTFTNKGNSSSHVKSHTTGISELCVDGGDKQAAAKGGEGGSAHLDAQSADGRLESETSSPIGSQASESSIMSLTSSKASFINNNAATTSTADSGPDGVQVMANRKVFREFTSLRIVQQWQAHAGVIWTVSFSDTGAFMATGGKDRIIRVWENKRAPVEAGKGDAGRGEGQNPEVFRTPALKEFFGHQDDIFDLSWSGNLFLLSASRDKTCMLWHLYSDAALKTFKHDDSVMSVAFHPVDSRHFVSAAWNGKVRLQCANPPRVVDWKQMQLLDALPIHCMRFNSRGDKVSVGSLHGRVRQYRVLPSLKLEHHAEIDVREKSRRRLDVPVTGLDTLAQRPEALLVTTRDSRVRLYNGPLLSVKYKGHRNKSSRIPATLSSDGTFVICGSDDGCASPPAGLDPRTSCAVVYIWRTDTEASVCLPRKKGCFTPSSGRLKTDSFEAFRAAPCMVTVAVFAPVVPDASLPPPAPFQAPVDPRTSVDHALTTTNGEESAVSLKSIAAVQNVLKSFKVDIKTGTKDAVQSARTEGLKLAAFGQVIVVASIDGMIQLFENVGSPKWL